MSSKPETKYLSKMKVKGQVLNEHPSTAYFEYKAEEYFSIPNKEDYYFQSTPFQFLNATWRLRIYPFGETESHSLKWIGLYVYKDESITPKPNVTYKLGIKKADGTEYESFTSKKDFKTKAEGWGKPFFLQRITLLKDKKKVAPSGTVTFFCSLSAEIKKDEDAKDDKNQTNLPESKEPDMNLDMKADMNLECLIEGNAGDVILSMKGRKFWVHKDILKAHSPAFKSLFDKELSEHDKDTIECPDYDPEAFKQLLLFLYYGKFPELSDRRVYDLFLVANFYGVQELREKCLEFIIKNISMDTFYDVLYLSVRCSDPKIVNHVNNFISAHTMEIISNERWLAFLRDYPLEANELYVKALKNNASKDENA